MNALWAFTGVCTPQNRTYQGNESVSLFLGFTIVFVVVAYPVRLRVIQAQANGSYATRTSCVWVAEIGFEKDSDMVY